MASPSVDLYRSRAEAVDPTFVLDASNGAGVAELCRCLEGLPLAIGLVAARVRVMPPAVALDRLRRDVLGVVGDRYRDGPDRHRSLRSAVEWTIAQLDRPARRLFERLGVVEGSFDLEDAELLAEEIGRAHV